MKSRIRLFLSLIVLIAIFCIPVKAEAASRQGIISKNELTTEDKIWMGTVGDSTKYPMAWDIADPKNSNDSVNPGPGIFLMSRVCADYMVGDPTHYYTDPSSILRSKAEGSGTTVLTKEWDYLLPVNLKSEYETDFNNGLASKVHMNADLPANCKVFAPSRAEIEGLGITDHETTGGYNVALDNLNFRAFPAKGYDASGNILDISKDSNRQTYVLRDFGIREHTMYIERVNCGFGKNYLTGGIPATGSLLALGTQISGYYSYVESRAGVRLATNLNIDKILYMTHATGGKASSGTGTNALSKISNADTIDWKCTFLDPARSGFQAEIMNCDSDIATISYKNAVSGGNNYISAMIEDQGYTYYGRLAIAGTSGTVSVNLKDKISANGTLYIMNEEYNGDRQSDFSSKLIKIKLPAAVKFNGNGGTVSTDTMRCDGKGCLADLPDAVKTGMRFEGWFTASGETGTQITTKTVFPMGETVTVYAHWKALPKITFNPNGGKVSPATAITNEKGRLSSIPTPALSGYSFKGWFISDDELGEIQVTSTTTFMDDTTVTAKWEKASGGTTSTETTPTTDGTVTRSASDISPENPTQAAAVEKAITTAKNDNDPKGSTFSLLQAKGVAKSNTSIKLTWNKVKGATKYIIYGNKCGKKNKYKKIKTVTGKTFTQKKLKKGTYYKYLIVAVKGSKALATSKTIHVATTGGKVGNNTAVKLSKTKLSLKAGKSKTITATLKKGSLPVKIHRKTAWESDNISIAKVSSKGKITAVGKGTCYIYAYAQNGVFAKIKVTVK